MRDWDLIEILNNLKTITIESDRERNIRISKNREKLENLVSSTHNAKL